MHFPKLQLQMNIDRDLETSAKESLFEYRLYSIERIFVVTAVIPEHISLCRIN